MNENDKREIDERLAEVDVDIEERLQKESMNDSSTIGQQQSNSVDQNEKTMQVDKSDDDDDDDSDEDGFPGNATKTIVAEG